MRVLITFLLVLSGGVKVKQTQPAMTDEPPSLEETSKPESTKSVWWPPLGLWDLYWPTCALVVVGAVATVTALRTLKGLEEQTGISKRAADAAFLNAQAMINAERPWIVVTAEIRTSGDLVLLATNAGRTPAEVLAHPTKCEMENSVDDLPVPAEYGLEILVHRKLLLPQEEHEIYRYPLGIIMSENVQMLAEIAESRKRFVVYGKVRYLDVLAETNRNPYLIPDSSHETRFCYWYNPALSKMLVGGPEGYNQHT